MEGKPEGVGRRDLPWDRQRQAESKLQTGRASLEMRGDRQGLRGTRREKQGPLVPCDLHSALLTPWDQKRHSWNQCPE